MATLPQDCLSILREKIKQQRNTVEALKREGHEHTDAERQLVHMREELQMYEKRCAPSKGQLATSLAPPELCKPIRR